jgi:peptide/nickel transport system substrate-binding protein
MSASIVKRAPLVGVVTVLLLAAACTGEDRSGSPPPVDEQPRGGTLRLAVPNCCVPQTELDPQLAYFSRELTRCCVHRTLYSYNGRPTDESGAELRPDLAAGNPEVSSDGLRWTFRLRRGLFYSPPLAETEIVAADLVRALEREAMVQGPYGYHFSLIEGFDDFVDGAADSIVGLETPDDHTLVVQLDEPSGDLAYRLSLPAAAPIPERAAEGHDRDYARFVVASGPYMVEGSDRLDFSVPPTEQEPLSGFVPAEFDEEGRLVTPGSLTLVRNPSWKASSDELRAAYVDRMEFILGGDDEELALAVDRGELDLVFGPDSSWADQVARYRQDPELAERVFLYPADAVYYVSMNLAVPPFDDLNVRKAVNLAIDKAPLLELITRPPYGPAGISSAEPATHIGADAVEGSLLPGFDPYVYDLAEARREMRLSPYDRNGDGRCDVAACRNVLALVNATGVVPDQARAIRDNLAGIGIELELDLDAPFEAPFPDFWGRFWDPAKRIPLVIGGAWGKDFPNGSGWFVLFAAASLENQGNHSLLGATTRQLQGWGYSVTSVPSVEDRLAACATRSGSAQTECWAELDQYLMNEVVPWVPYMFVDHVQVVSERVVAYSFDQFGPQPALDRIALAPGSS